MSVNAIVVVFGYAALGYAAGFGFFAALRWNLALYLSDAPLRAVALHLLRLVVTAAIFASAAIQGAAPALIALLGLLAARRTSTRRVRVLS